MHFIHPQSDKELRVVPIYISPRLLNQRQMSVWVKDEKPSNLYQSFMTGTRLFCTSRVNMLRADALSLLTDEQAEVPETRGHGRKWNSRDEYHYKMKAAQRVSSQ